MMQRAKKMTQFLYSAGERNQKENAPEKMARGAVVSVRSLIPSISHQGVVFKGAPHICREATD